MKLLRCLEMCEHHMHSRICVGTYHTHLQFAWSTTSPCFTVTAF